MEKPIEEYKNLIPKKVYEILSDKLNFLRPPQYLAIEKGLFKNNLVVSSPTASGKTLVAEMAILNKFFEGKKSVYIVPLRSLAMEKYEEFSKKYENLMKIAISIGDLDSSDPWLEEYDLIIVTSEKMDSLIRHRAKWIEQVGLVVIDECHMIGMGERGATLEILITKLKKISNPQIIALSATIKNADELAEWLNGEVVKTNYRPVKLYEYIYYKGILTNGKTIQLEEKKTGEETLAWDTLKKGKQALFFVSTRRYAESLAERLSKVTEKFLEWEDRGDLAEGSKKVLNVLESPTRQCKKLSNLILKGIAFHHAGLVNEQRKIVERLFREGRIKILCATPTLAMGVNLPAFRVIIRDLKRYDPSYGSTWIPVLEYKQFAGRAGRPGYEEFGEAISFAKSIDEIDEIRERYIMGEPEEIYSVIASKPLLRFHLLSLISDGFIRDENSLKNFFSKTFYYFQSKDENIIEKVWDIVAELRDWGFLIVDKKIKATMLGKRISELYIDPLSAKRLIDGLKRANKNEIGFLHLVCRTTEMRPLLNISTKEFYEIEEKLGFVDLFEPEPSVWSYDYEEYLRAFKTALMLKDWINEKTEDYILENYRVSPGDLRNYISNAEWMLYSLREIGKIIGINKDLLDYIDKLRFRVKKGIREELIDLARIKGIGRIRARKLYSYGIKSIKDLKEIDLLKLKQILGEKLAERIKSEASKLS